MPESDFIFSKAVVTRFSHDLAGVISAISNSLSLLNELGGADQETLTLAEDNANTLMGRLRFFRAAFGNEGPLTDIAATQRIFEDYLASLENRAVHYKCVWQTDQELPIFIFRLILLTGVIGAESLPRGGQITVQAQAGSRRVLIMAEGKAAVLDPLVQSVLDKHDLTEISSPKVMPAIFLYNCLNEQNWQISLSCRDEKIIIELGEKR
ncbi:MAG: hypothetical protein IJ752_08780 [Alphaproteobacteria bacterium]|nr:hypothetical protein [Alphaproteobacteria bacterium]